MLVLLFCIIQTYVKLSWGGNIVTKHLENIYASKSGNF